MSPAGRLGPVGCQRLRERLPRLHRRQRPAGDRARERPVDEPREAPPTADRKSCSISTRVDPGPGRLDRPGHVHAPASRRRRGGTAAAASPGSCHVRLRHATGIPNPSHGTRTRRATKSQTSAPSRRRRMPGPRVVGEQPLPAGDVAREAEDELGRRGDVDADGASASQPPVRSRAQARRDRPAGWSRAGRPAGSSAARSVEPPTSSRNVPPVTVAR